MARGQLNFTTLNAIRSAGWAKRSPADVKTCRYNAEVWRREALRVLARAGEHRNTTRDEDRTVAACQEAALQWELRAEHQRVAQMQASAGA